MKSLLHAEFEVMTVMNDVIRSKILVQGMSKRHVQNLCHFFKAT